VPREAGGWVGLMFEAMVSPSQRKERKMKRRARREEEVIGRLTYQTKENYG